MTHPHREFNPDPVLLAYLITFRALSWIRMKAHGHGQEIVDTTRSSLPSI